MTVSCGRDNYLTRKRSIRCKEPLHPCALSVQLKPHTHTHSRHIPTIAVQGRYDVVCPVCPQTNYRTCNAVYGNPQATTAYALKKAWPEITLHIVPDAGHSSLESG